MDAEQTHSPTYKLPSHFDGTSQHSTTMVASARLVLAALVLLAPPASHCFLIPKRGGGGGSGGVSGGSSTDVRGAGWGLGRLLAEALEGGAKGASGSGVQGHPNMRRADELLSKRGASNYLEAYKLLKELCAQEPGDHTLKLKVAEASVSYLRTTTNANAVMVDGISDSEENRRLWREYAFEAYDLLRDVHKTRPDDPHVNVLIAEVRSDVSIVVILRTVPRLPSSQ